MSSSTEPLTCSHVKIFFSHTKTSKSAEFKVVEAESNIIISGSQEVKKRDDPLLLQGSRTQVFCL